MYLLYTVYSVHDEIYYNREFFVLFPDMGPLLLHGWLRPLLWALLLGAHAVRADKQKKIGKYTYN